MAFSKKELFRLLPQLVSERARAVCHPARVEIFMHLAKHGETSFADLKGLIPLHETTISQHVRILLRHDLVLVYERVPHTYYELNPETSRVLVLVLNHFVQFLLDNGVDPNDLKPPFEM